MCPLASFGGSQDYLFVDIDEVEPRSLPVINDHGELAYQKDTRILRSDGHTVVTIADLSDGFTRFALDSTSINNSGVVVFNAVLITGDWGVFIGAGERQPTTVAQTGMVTDAGATIRFFGINPVINDNGTVAFHAWTNSGQAILVASGGSIISITDSLVSLLSVATPAINNSGQIAHYARFEDGTRSILRFDGERTVTIADNSDRFGNFSFWQSMNEAGSVAFRTMSLEGFGIFVGAGGELVTIVSPADPFENVGFPNINDHGEVVFNALSDGTLSICDGPDPAKDRVISSGDTLFGKQVASMMVVSGALNNAGQIAFLTWFEDGTKHVVRADPDCNHNGIFDKTDIESGVSADEDRNLIPDECAIMIVPLDIRPGGCPNPVNRASRGVLPVALLGTADFDVSEVDVSTLALTREGVSAPVAPVGVVIEDVAAPFEGELCDCHEAGPDGIPDLLLRFDIPELVSILELNAAPDGESVPLALAGELLAEAGGRPIVALDCVKLVPPSDINGDGRVNLRDFVVMARCFGAAADHRPNGCSPNDVVGSDIDGNGAVNLSDFSTFARHFGQ